MRGTTYTTLLSEYSWDLFTLKFQKVGFNPSILPSCLIILGNCRFRGGIVKLSGLGWRQFDKEQYLPTPPIYIIMFFPKPKSMFLSFQTDCLTNAPPWALDFRIYP